MSKLKNIPNLRFPEFKGDWEMKKLGEVAPLQRGFDLPVDNIKIGEFPVVFSNGILKHHNEFKAKAPGVVTGRSGTIGKVTYVEKDYWPHNTSLWVTNFNDNYPKFIFYFYSKYKLERFGTGSGVPTLNRNNIHIQKEFFPSILEQQKIASFLSAVDEKIQQLSRKKELLSQYKKGVMQQLFSGKLRFKPARPAGGDENGEDYEDWEEKKLGDIGETYNGLTGKTKEDFGNGKPYVQYKQIFDNSRIDISRFELVNIGADERQKKVIFGDVFFTVSSETPNEIGTASVLLDQIDELYLNSFCFGYRANSLELLSPYFSRYLFRSELFRNEIVKLAQGSTRYNMSKVQLMKLKIQLPCLEEQQKIANFLSSIDAKIESTNQQINQTQGFKKGLLQQLFV